MLVIVIYEIGWRYNGILIAPVSKELFKSDIMLIDAAETHIERPKKQNIFIHTSDIR